jgi:nucleotide-binding universal stress UspA family protein
MLIAHASDLTGDDAAAFVHAAALAAATGARLVTTAAGASPGAVPDTAALVARWGRPIDHAFVRSTCCDEVEDTVIDCLRELRPDLVVVGTHARHGWAALVHASVGAAIARNLEVPVLIIPNRGRGFVDAATGAIDLRRILVPAGTAADARRGTAAARALLAMAIGSAPAPSAATVEIVHVGPAELELERAGFALTRLDGPLDAAIVAAAAARDTCLIVMPTHGHDGFGDVLLGSHTEHVVRDAARPVLSVPI